MDGQKLRKLEKLNSLHQTSTKVKKEKLLIWYYKTSDVKLSEQRVPKLFCSIIVTASTPIVFARKKIAKIFSRNFAMFSHFLLNLFKQKKAIQYNQY